MMRRRQGTHLFPGAHTQIPVHTAMKQQSIWLDLFSALSTWKTFLSSKTRSSRKWGSTSKSVHPDIRRKCFFLLHCPSRGPITYLQLRFRHFPTFLQIQSCKTIPDGLEQLRPQVHVCCSVIFWFPLLCVFFFPLLLTRVPWVTGGLALSCSCGARLQLLVGSDTSWTSSATNRQALVP